MDSIHWITGIETGRAVYQIRLKTVLPRRGRHFACRAALLDMMEKLR